MALSLAIGCSHTLITTEEVIQTTSCVNGARSVRVQIAVGAPVFDVSWDGGSANVIGTPLIENLGGSVQVTAELDSVPAGNEVTLRFLASVLAGFASVTVTDIQFYTVPPDQIPPDPGCTPSSSPIFALLDDPHLGLALQVSNPSSQLLTLTQLELTVAPNLLPASSLDWASPEFNALPWQPALPGGTPLDPLAPPIVIDLPDAAPGSNAALCRYRSQSQGRELRGILQLDLTGTLLPVMETTWSGVKAKFRR